MQQNPYNPYAHTLDDKVTELISKLLGQIAPGVGPFLTGLIKNPVYSMLGLNPNDVMLNAIVDTNQTPFGAYNLLQNNSIKKGGQYAIHSIANAAKLNAFRGLSGTLTSDKAWARLGAAERGASYKEYIENKALEKSSSIPWNMLYGMWDPNGIGKASPFLSDAASNMIRKGVSRGDRDSYAKAGQIMRGMFTDDTGKYDFKERDYGYMNQTDVAAIAANLTKDMDILANTGGKVTRTQLKGTTDKFKKVLQEYSKALAPLKDVFGDDIASMLKTMESVTGSSMGSLGAGRVRQIATHIADNLASGKFTAEEFFIVNNQFKASLGATKGISRFTKQQSHMLAMDTLGGVNGGAIPIGFDKKTFASNVARMNKAIATGGLAEIADLAYAGWTNAQNAKAKPGEKVDTSIDAFKADIDRMTRDGKTSYITALYKLGGNYTNQYAMRSNQAFASYRVAKEKGVGMNVAFDKRYSDLRESTARAISRSGVIRQLAAKDGFTGENAQTDRETARDAISFLEKDAALLSPTLSNNDMLISLANKVKKEGEKDITSIEEFKALRNTTAGNQRYGRAMRAKYAIELLKNNDRYAPFLQSLTYRQNLQQHRKEMRLNAKRRAAFEQMSGSGIDTIKSNISKILGLDTGEGFSMKTLNEVLQNHVKLKGIDKDVAAEIGIAMKTASESFIRTGLSVNVKDSENAKFGESIYDKDGNRIKATSDNVAKAYIDKAAEAFDAEKTEDQWYNDFSKKAENKGVAKNSAQATEAYKKYKEDIKAEKALLNTWFNDVYKKKPGNEKAVFKDSAALRAAYAEYMYGKDKKALQDYSLNAGYYNISNAGLHNSEYRNLMNEYKNLESQAAKAKDPAAIRNKMKELAPLIEVARTTSPDVLSDYLNTNRGALKDNPNATEDQIREANIKRLSELHKKGGDKEVKSELKRAAMEKNMLSLRSSETYGSHVSALEKKFINSHANKDKFSNKDSLFDKANFGLYSIKEFEEFAVKERDAAKAEADRLSKGIEAARKRKLKDDDANAVADSADPKAKKISINEAKKRLQQQQRIAETASSIITQSNRSKQGMDTILTTLSDVLKALNSTLKEAMVLVGQKKGEKNSS